MKIYDKRTHCCLIYGGYGPNVMPKTIIEELELQSTNDCPGKIIGFNNSLHKYIGAIKYVTLLICTDPKIRTT